jgi:hypothetical protein
MNWAQLPSTVIIALLSSISGQLFMVISHLESDLNKKTYIVIVLFVMTTMDDYDDGIRCESPKYRKENYVFMLTFRTFGWAPLQS